MDRNPLDSFGLSFCRQIGVSVSTVIAPGEVTGIEIGSTRDFTLNFLIALLPRPFSPPRPRLPPRRAADRASRLLGVVARSVAAISLAAACFQRLRTESQSRPKSSFR
jgi:hypothetical protein